MVGLLLATVVFAVIVALGCAVLLGVIAAPLFTSLQLAESRRFSTARWGTVSLAGSALGLGSALLLHRHGVALPVLLLPLALTWAGPAALALTPASRTALGGAAGRHE